MSEPAKKQEPSGRKEQTGTLWEFKLYVAGKSPKSFSALENLEAICEEYLKGSYRIVLVDVVDHPEVALKEQIIALPTLVRELPKPVRRVIGDLSRREIVLVRLDLVDRPAGKVPNGP